MDVDDARAFAEELVADLLPQRWRHVRAVAAATASMCERLDLDPRFVVSAAWLHDIGYSPFVADTGFHPLDGARLLRSEGWDDLICELVAHHTDAARQAAAYALDWDLEREFPKQENVLHDVLWAADATTGPDGQLMTVDERIVEVRQRYGADHAVTYGMLASRGELVGAIARVEGRVATVSTHV